MLPVFSASVEPKSALAKAGMVEFAFRSRARPQRKRRAFSKAGYNREVSGSNREVLECYYCRVISDNRGSISEKERFYPRSTER